MAAEELTFAYNHVAVRLLEWDAGSDSVTDKMKWQPEFEVAFDHITYRKENSSILYMDTALYLSDSKTDYAAMIKVRSVFTITTFDEYPAGVMMVMMNMAINHARAICACRCDEEKINLPVIPYFTSKRLAEIEGQVLHKASVASFSYEQKSAGKTLTISAHSAQFEIPLTHRTLNWFEPLPHSHPDAITSGKDATTADFGFNFDFEQMDKEEWKFHIDITITVYTIARACVRTSFYVPASEKELFSAELMLPLYCEAVQQALDSFDTLCKDHKFDFATELKAEELKEVYTSGAEQAIHLYYNWRKAEYEHNKPLLGSGLSITVGQNTQLILKGVFLILDEILFLNPAFDHRHNQDALAESLLPLPLYYTLKRNCLAIEHEPVQLSWMNTIQLFIAIDIALQLLLSEHGDTLQPALLQKNFFDLRQKEFIQFSGEMLNSQIESMREAKMTVSNLDERKDWTGIIR